jgi:hypothetical protein
MNALMQKFDEKPQSTLVLFETLPLILRLMLLLKNDDETKRCVRIALGNDASCHDFLLTLQELQLFMLDVVYDACHRVGD